MGLKRIKRNIRYKNTRAKNQAIEGCLGSLLLLPFKIIVLPFRIIIKFFNRKIK